MEPRTAFIPALFLLTSIFYMAGEEATVAGAPTLDEGTYLEFRYEAFAPDGAYTKEGVRTATVSLGTWTGTDCLIFSGTDEGEFSAGDHFGSYSGEYRSYYNYDLALMHEWSSVTTEIDGISVIETNESTTSYGFPYHRWISLPMDPPESWENNVTVQRTWNLYYSDGTDDSGNDAFNIDWKFLCFSTEEVSVGAGTYNAHKILGNRQNDAPLDRSTETWYSEDIGWWVEKNVWADNGVERVLVEHHELVEVSTNSPPEAAPSPSVVMDEDDSDDSIILSSLFSDPDGDPLTYSISGNGSLPVTISSGRVVITPPADVSGDWVFLITAMDDKGSSASVDVDVTVLPVDDSPVLSSPMVSPSSGDETTVFTFSIRMVDIDGYSSSDLILFVDSLEYYHGSDPGPAVDGVTLSWEMTLPVGAHSHHFLVDGTREPASGEIDGPEVLSSYTPRLGNPSLSMVEAGTGDDIDFEITWTYGGGEYPDSCKVYVDGSVHEMEELEGKPEEGVRYVFSTSLSEGLHYYHFEARLGLDFYRYPSGGDLEGPAVYDPELISFGHSPDGLVDRDEATFFAVFEYGHEEAPTVCVVVLDGIEHELTATSGDLGSGVNYTAVLEVSSGTHTYSFRFEVSDEVLTSSSGSFTVGPAEGGGPADGAVTPRNEGGVSPLLILLIFVVLAAAAVLLYFLFIRKGKGEVWEESEYERVSLELKP